MVYDFGLMKLSIKEIIDSFDHAITLYSGDSSEYIADMKKHSVRWIELPVSPSAEQFSRVFFLLIERIIECSEMCNGERDVRLHSIIVHETQSGYAQCFYEDAHSKLMGNIDLANITFSPQIMSEWSQQSLFDDILHLQPIKNPKMV
jgi:6-pyruvoyltetrahydropterin/6-carboxytetrahydropterin synthase